MNWWRAHHGISNDSKLAVIALKANAKKCEVGWIWIILLDYASQAEGRGCDRGCVSGLDAEQISLIADVPIETVERIMDILNSRGLIGTDGHLTAWEKRQPREEDRTAAERQRRRRKLLKEQDNGHGMSRRDTVTVTAVTAEERRGDERREEQTLFAAEAAESEIPKHPEIVVRPNVPTRRRKSNRSTSEIKRDLGPERLSWWEGFWKEYPCHEGMNAAMAAFEVKINDRDTAASAWKAARAYSAKFSADPEMKLKYGQGWINEERWLDEIRPPANGTHGVSGSDPRNLDGYQELR